MIAPAPSVIALNGTLAGIEVREFVILVSGLRPISTLTELDTIRYGHSPASGVHPASCTAISVAYHALRPGHGEAISLERYQFSEDCGKRKG